MILRIDEFVDRIGGKAMGTSDGGDTNPTRTLARSHCRLRISAHLAHPGQEGRALDTSRSLCGRGAEFDLRLGVEIQIGSVDQRI